MDHMMRAQPLLYGIKCATTATTLNLENGVQKWFPWQHALCSHYVCTLSLIHIMVVISRTCRWSIQLPRCWWWPCRCKTRRYMWIVYKGNCEGKDPDNHYVHVLHSKVRHDLSWLVVWVAFSVSFLQSHSIVALCTSQPGSVTVEPLLKDTLNKGHLHVCYKGHLPESQISCYTCSYFLSLMRGHLTVKDKKYCPIGVGVPLYIILRL